MRGIRCVLAAVLAAGIVTVVAAQPGRQMGGFGGGQDTVTLVLTNKALQEEVKVTDEQKSKFKEIAAKQMEMGKKAMAGMKDKFEEAKGDKDKMKEVFEEMQKENSKTSAEIKKLLEAELTSEQKTRLHQIAVQVLGVDAFADPDAKTGGGFGGGRGFGGGFSEAQKGIIKDVASALKLTDDQKSKIKSALSEYTKDRDAIRKDIFGESKKGGFDQEKMKDFAEKSGKLSSETMDKIAEVLDDTQKTAWKGLVGAPFDTSKLRPTPPPKKD
ncbi:hypothetical protein [Frigoriglobus tundricola]|uniref:Uncharacterized protein n=1 Tax=Frigoriglobus tundricola TaxID=2774151 RepID=A0A6M5Z0C8_9BACT|nr:hypothetical protein [Frigoriglobus tundricola]QJW99186.1 hypothetical protein FTUN_6786 [Frigoriglobus tundricola]